MLDRTTTRRLKKLVFPIAALAVVGALAPTSSMAAAPAAPSPDVTVSAATTSSLAPVSLPGHKASQRYTAAQVRANDRRGGDPAVLGYWTAKRMRAAQPLDVPGDAKVISQTVRALTKQQPQVASRPAAPRPNAKLKGAAVPVTNFSVTNGKLFIGGYGSGSWCSASALNTPSKRVVITAGHCVHSGKGGTWRSNLVFVPGYNAYSSNPAPRGMFQAYQLRTFNAWINDSDLNRDVGFVTTYTNVWGQRVVDAVGGHGFAYNGGTEFDVSIFGYPSNRDSGNRMWACWGTATDNSWFDNKSKITCNFGPGSSGGPWLWNYSNATGQGYARSVMSTVNGDGVNKGPYFDTAVRDAKDAANNDWPNPT